MKNLTQLLFTLFCLCLPAMLQAQDKDDSKYLAGAVPEVDGKVVDCFPVGGALERAKPVYEYLPGFRCDISKCRRPEELPRAALEYVRYIEKQVGCPVKYVSVGAQREDIIEMF